MQVEMGNSSYKVLGRKPGRKMSLRICVTSIGDSLSICGLGEDEFRRRINQAGGKQIQVIFIQKKIGFHLCKAKRLLARVSYLFLCLRNLPSLIKQDILIADGIELTGLIVCLFCKLFRKKSMITIHAHYKQEWAISKYSKVEATLLTIVDKFILRFADLFVTNDQQVKQDFIDKGVESSRLLVRYVFADSQKFSRDNTNKEQLRKFSSLFKLPERYILYVGRLGNCDGAEDMLAIIKQLHNKLPTVKFVLIGEGQLKSRVNSFVLENGLSQCVFQIDKVDHELMPFVYYGAETIIFPVHPPQAGVGRITLEALSMEVPVIAYDIGELYLVVRNDETGYLIPEGNTGLVAAKAISLLANPELKRRLGINGRELVQSIYDIDIYINNWLTSLDSLVPNIVGRGT